MKVNRYKQVMYTVVFVTTSGKKEAQRIARALIKEKLAACVNIIDRVESLFWWKGKVDRSREALLIIKTKKALASRLIKKIKALHSYKVPEIIGLPVVFGNKAYLEWIDESVR